MAPKINIAVTKTLSLSFHNNLSIYYIQSVEAPCRQQCTFTLRISVMSPGLNIWIVALCVVNRLDFSLTEDEENNTIILDLEVHR